MTKHETLIAEMADALNEEIDYLDGIVDASGEDNGEGSKAKYYLKLVKRADKLLK